MAEQTLAEMIGANITAARKNRGVNQGWLSDRTGVNQSSISMYESGQRLAGTEFLVKVATALECPMVSLFKGVGADSDTYRQGYADGWAACADDVSGHLTWKPKGGRFDG
jgi:transcriptional regulator with XRE-family HTH domain